MGKKSLQKKKSPEESENKYSPLPLSQAEVEALISGDAKMHRQIASRLKAATPAPLPTTDNPKSDKASPPRITRSEMEQIKRSGNVPRKILKRLEQQAEKFMPEEDAKQHPKKDEPDQVPKT